MSSLHLLDNMFEQQASFRVLGVSAYVIWALHASPYKEIYESIYSGDKGILISNFTRIYNSNKHLCTTQVNIHIYLDAVLL